MKFERIDIPISLQTHIGSTWVSSLSEEDNTEHMLWLEKFGRIDIPICLQTHILSICITFQQGKVVFYTLPKVLRKRICWQSLLILAAFIRILCQRLLARVSILGNDKSKWLQENIKSGKMDFRMNWGSNATTAFLFIFAGWWNLDNQL